MPISTRKPCEKAIVPTSGQFTDRDEFKDSFWNTLKDLNIDEVKVLVYYGVGGIGKTSLRHELQRSLKEYKDEVNAYVDFSEEEHRVKQEALMFLRTQLKQNYQITFTHFDFAYVYYLRKTNPTMPLSKSKLPFLDEGDFVLQVINELKDLPFIGLIPKTLQYIYKCVNYMYGKKISADIDKLTDISRKEPSEILALLPELFAFDLYEYLEGSGRNAIIFIDTFEALWEHDRSIGNFCDRDDWIHDILIRKLPGVLWIICSREQLRWVEQDTNWEGSLFQYRIDKFSNDHMKSYLKSCNIKDADIQEFIINNSDGLPYFLSLVSQESSIIKVCNNELTLNDLNCEKIIEKSYKRFVKYLDRQEQATINILSILNHWNEEIFELVIENFKTGYPLTAFEEFCKFSFILECSPTGNKDIYLLMKKCIVAKQNETIICKVNRFMFNYYCSKIEHAVISNNLMDTKVFIEEAFYHGLSLCDKQHEANNFIDWFITKESFFMDIFKLESPKRLMIRLVNMVERKINYEFNIDVKLIYKNIMELYEARLSGSLISDTTIHLEENID